MKLAASSVLLVAVLGACEREAAKPASVPPAPVVSPKIASAAPGSDPSAPDAGSAASSLPPGSVPDAAAPSVPLKVQRSGKVWPFHAWNRAEAVTFNKFADRPGTPLVAYDDERGWNGSLAERKPLDVTQGRKAVDFVVQTSGGVDVSKCPFPRHAVVLYEGTLPVATINVCFACGDILLWPRWGPEPNGSMTAKEQKERMGRQATQLKAYDRVFPKWQAFFRDEVGFPIDATYR